MRILNVTGTLAAAGGALTFAAYWKEITAARRRIETERQAIDSVEGTIEYAVSGDGPPLLVVHGAGGGFDQGLDLGRFFGGDGYRIIAPSRFGYLGTPLPADASPEAQADAHLRLLDALQLDRVPVIGVSAGSPSAMQLCLRHPERTSALVLIVPLAYAPERASGRTLPRFVDAVLKSDFLFWTAMKIAHATLIETILGVPMSVYRNATPADRRNVDQMLQSILPISRRAKGISNEIVVANTLTRYPLEEMRVPTLVIGAEDCLYRTYESGRYTAEHIPGAKFAGFPTGGHLLVGHDAEVRTQVTTFLKKCLEAEAEVGSFKSATHR